MTSNRLILVLVVLLGVLLVGCGTATVEKAPAEAPAVSSAPADNVLTDAEKADGWQLLFDGKSLDQWRGFRADTVPPGWTIDGDTLMFKADDGKEGFGDLTTKEQFADFDLKLQWKISPCGNSGVLFRVTEDSDQEWHSGPEVQIVDATEGCWSDYKAPEGQKAPGSDLKTTQLSGANYDLHAPSVRAEKPVGEWNDMRILVNGPHVEQWLNGQKVVEYELWSDQWKDMVSKSKFVDYPKYGMNKIGYIVLQDHGKNVWFKNIKIKVLNK